MLNYPDYTITFRAAVCCSVVLCIFGCGPKWEPAVPPEDTQTSPDTDSAGDTDSATHQFSLRVVGENQPLSEFVAILRDNDTLQEITCPGEAAGADTDIYCTNEEIHFSSVRGPLNATIKSPGYEYGSLALSPKELETLQEFTITLLPLAAFETNSDYATGFDSNGTAADFLVYGQPSGSPLGAQYVVKFYIELTERPTVYFMNTNTHFLHYPFVHDILRRTLSEIEFLKQTYVDADRTALAGTLLYFPDAQVPIRDGSSSATAPLVMTFFPSDKLTPNHAATAHRLIEERLGFLQRTGDSHRLYYLPPGEQQLNDLQSQIPEFEDAGIPWMKKSELYASTSMQILNNGEAYGTLRQLSAEALESAVFSFQDILLLSTLPVDLPLVGGTITEELQTPLSHVNVAAMNRGTPNIALPGASSMESVNSLIDSLVHFVVADGSFTLEPATQEEAESFWASQQPPLITLSADVDFSEIQPLENIVFTDSIRFGAKAANVAELSVLMPANTPHGFAVPFYFYDRFTAGSIVTGAHCTEARADCVSENRNALLCETAENICLQRTDISLQQFIESVIELDSFGTDAQLRDALLDGIRFHFEHIPVADDVTAEINSRVLEEFGTQKIRLRSSTNAEDLPEFSGAGLYESVSAYGNRADDLPSDEIRKVWASIWNFRAYEERRFWNIDHLSVHMGVLVHQAFPDEAANGVLITRNLAEPTVDGFYVNVQVGEYSVTNPELGSPQIFAILPGASSGSVQSAIYAYSSLMPDQSIISEQEVLELYNAAVTAQEHFAALYGISYWPLAVFDMEFKFHGPARQLVVKQIRPF